MNAPRREFAVGEPAIDMVGDTYPNEPCTILEALPPNADCSEWVYIVVHQGDSTAIRVQSQLAPFEP